MESIELDKVITHLLEVKHSFYMKDISFEEFNKIRDKLLDAKELVRSIMELLNQKKEDELEAIIQIQNLYR